MAPSSRMVSPFSITFSMMWQARAAYSAGWPSRTGKGTWRAIDWRAGSGSIAIIDFRLDSPQGPPKSARIAPDRVKAELKAAGYSLAREHSFLTYQYFLIFRPAGS